MVDTNAITTWQLISELALTIDEAPATRQLSLDGATSFTRITTEVLLSGAGHTGVGENVAYQSDVHAAIAQHLPTIDLRGTWTLGGLAEHLDATTLVPPGEWFDYASFHRCAIESAALDLALQQAGSNLAELCDTTFTPVRFCVSMGLGSPPDSHRALEWIECLPNIEFKLDASREWNDDLVDELAATSRVRVVDIKAHYTGDWIDNTPDPELYERIASRLPGVLIEDAWLDETTRKALGDDALARLSWDAPIHSVSDLNALTITPAAINIKPSRIDSLRELLAIIQWCAAREIPCYAGGQFELGRGRTQAQQLASLFYPHAVNDIAPATWHTARPGDKVDVSPLPIPTSPGFGWQAS